MTKARAGVAHIAIVLTDGQSQDWQVTYDEASRAQHAGIDMFAIGVGKVDRHLYKCSIFPGVESLSRLHLMTFLLFNFYYH